MTKLPHAIMATVDRLEEDQSILKTEDGQTITWPTKLLGEIHEGATVYITVLKDEDTEVERSRFAKQVLNEILQGE